MKKYPAYLLPGDILEDSGRKVMPIVFNFGPSATAKPMDLKMSMILFFTD
jgi:hypothetical protein